MNLPIALTRRTLLASTTAAAALVSAPSLATAIAMAKAGDPTPVVQTSNGPVQGLMESGSVYAFKGLRYAAPPVGMLRFRPPQPVTKWTAVVDASDFGNSAIQTPGPDALKTETHSEDCLFLNVWTNGLDLQKRPVMVWLHGGGYWEGSPDRPTYYGDHFARDGVVLVSVTHRLNVFGFAQLPESWGPDYTSSGLAGILDIVAALQWVKENATQFGGDPDNVTIFGESGGGGKVSLLLGMPPAQGLYHKAIIQSGAQLDAAPRAYAQALGGALLDDLGIKPGDVAALAAADTQAIFKAQDGAVKKVQDLAVKDGFLQDGFVPSIDGVNLPRGPFTPDATPLSINVPLIVGNNKDEMALFMVNSPGFGKQTDEDFEKAVRAVYPTKVDQIVAALRSSYPGYSPAYLLVAFSTARLFWLNSVILAERKTAQNAAPVYMYLMTHDDPAFGGALKAAHATELSYVFGTYDSIRFFVGPGPGPAQMAAQMHPAWIAFARSGNPDTGAIPHWPRYDVHTRATMIFDLESKVEDDPYSEIRRLMAND
ncbi:MAG: carboxylesterase/lipase family protein [Alphaproteobacteria bacterium]|nr:carboxylesterase/lipase family protein [Alphaproteobacteria bacterium]MDE2494046.1 carboxylesterase/lipase family protein [Alphaproteobacteria bacterium]